MRENRQYGSVRGVAGDRYPYRDSACPVEGERSSPLGLGHLHNELSLRTWRGHSCLQRRHSCRRRFGGTCFSLSSRAQLDLKEGNSPASYIEASCSAGRENSPRIEEAA